MGPAEVFIAFTMSLSGTFSLHNTRKADDLISSSDKNRKSHYSVLLPSVIFSVIEELQIHFSSLRAEPRERVVESPFWP